MLIFLVDDDDIFNYLHEAVIKSTVPHATVVAFKSGSELIAHVEKNQDTFTAPNLILMDVRMPEMDGFKLLDNLQSNYRSTFSNTTIYMLSSTLDERDLQRAKSYQMVTDFLEKPLTIELFDDILKKAN